MITQYLLRLESGGRVLPAQLAYPLYAALLERAPGAFSTLVHQPGFTPVCQYLHDNIWYVSLLCPEAVHALSPILEDWRAVTLHRDGIRLNAEVLDHRTIAHPTQFLDCPILPEFHLEFRSPTAFKSGGNYQLLPTQRFLIQSLLLRWNAYFAEICPIEDDGEGLNALAQGLAYRAVTLQTQNYQMKQAVIPGVVGHLHIQNQLNGFHRQLANALFHFGVFSGCGIKTALGMGGITIQKLNGECIHA